MAIPATVKDYLDLRGAEYDVVSHTFTGSSVETAKSTHISGQRIAKAVVLGDTKGYIMAVVPATHQVQLEQLQHTLKRELDLVTEEELCDLFLDCEVGAVPPVGNAYGIETVIDNRVIQQPDIYFEAGDHEELIHMTGEQFRSLMEESEVSDFGRKE